MKKISKRERLFIVMGVIIVALGAGGLYYYLKHNKSSADTTCYLSLDSNFGPYVDSTLGTAYPNYGPQKLKLELQQDASTSKQAWDAATIIVINKIANGNISIMPKLLNWEILTAPEREAAVKELFEKDIAPVYSGTFIKYFEGKITGKTQPTKALIDSFDYPVKENRYGSLGSCSLCNKAMTPITNQSSDFNVSDVGLTGIRLTGSYSISANMTLKVGAQYTYCDSVIAAVNGLYDDDWKATVSLNVAKAGRRGIGVNVSYDANDLWHFGFKAYSKGF